MMTRMLEELQEEGDHDDHLNRVKFQEHSEDGLTAAEEDELYEENDERRRVV